MVTVKRVIKFVWNCMCYAEGVKGWSEIAMMGGITPQEYVEIEKRLREEYIDRSG